MRAIAPAGIGSAGLKGPFSPPGPGRNVGAADRRAVHTLRKSLISGGSEMLHVRTVPRRQSRSEH